VSSINNTGFRRTFASFVVIFLLTGCQAPGKLRNPLAQSENGKQSWASRIPKSLRPISKPENLEPIDQELALARSLELQGKTDEAIYTYSTILAKEDRADAHHRLAVLHDKRGSFQASEEHYQVALKLDPKNAELLCDRGYSYLLQDRLEDAQDHLKKAIKRDPTLNRAHNNLGLLLAQQGHVDRALVEFAAAGCSHAEARTNLACALTMAGKVADAAYHLEIARQADDSLLPAGQLESALGQRMIGSVRKSRVPPRVTANSPSNPPVGESNVVTQTTTKQVQEAPDRQIVALPPIDEQSCIASQGWLVDYQIKPCDDILPMPADEETVDNQQFDDILRMSANVEPDFIQQPSQGKRAQLRRALVRLNEPTPLMELQQPLSLRPFNRQ
jgi:tetratricopeptide (TPR) repeat protein